MLHSPEPYYVDEYNPGRWWIRRYLPDGSIHTIAQDVESRETAERLVICANSMAGIPACDLPKVRALWEQRNQLLECQAIHLANLDYAKSSAEYQNRLFNKPEICGPAGPMPPLEAAKEQP